MSRSEEPNKQDKKPISREALYELAWAEPMTSIGKKLGVSSSYLARIYTRLNVPRPAAGYWAKVAAGKPPHKPPLPDVELGYETEWDRYNQAPQIKTSRPTTALKPRNTPKKVLDRPSLHPIIRGAKEHFSRTRNSDDGYLRPFKRILVDIVVSKEGLDTALNIANQFFFALEDFDHKVIIPPASERFCRHSVDKLIKPPTGYHSYSWSPDRRTIVYVGGVPIGLTILELSKTIEARYVNGEYLPLSDPRAIKESRDIYSWTTSHTFPSGKFCVQAFSPYYGTSWSTYWEVPSDRSIKTLGHKIAKELNQHAAVISELQLEAKRKDEQRRIEYKEHQKQYRAEQAILKKQKSEEESRQELLSIIEKWSESKKIEAFINAIQAEISLASPENQSVLRERLNLAKQSLSSTNALEALANWSSPDERLEPVGNS
tara:strand:+ start:33271 stop:34563 length:1293 start_codon:yes stop_codon:yes gene_type:complete